MAPLFVEIRINNVVLSTVELFHKFKFKSQSEKSQLAPT